MFEAVSTPYLVPFDGSFRRADSPTEPPDGAPDEEKCLARLEKLTGKLNELQQRLYADDRHAVLLVFQALDAAGKDGTIRSVLRGVDPSGCQVYSFKRPSLEELDHDFLWRTTRCLPERGRIGVFNRSYYEEVLVVRVHPQFLTAQRLPEEADPSGLWRHRFQSILDHEAHLARNGTVVLKFWLNVSRREQRRRFLSRLEEPRKNWKFSVDDVRERGFWDDYMQAYEEALRATSRPWAPWYAIPADSKPYMRYRVAETLVQSLERLDLEYPAGDIGDPQRLGEMRALLE